MKNLVCTFAILLSFSTSTFSQEYSFVFLNHIVDRPELPDEEEKSLMDQHRANMDTLEAEGKLIAAGPFEGGGGILVLRTPDQQIAKEWLFTDPAVRTGRWDVEILPLNVLEGGVCLTSEPYEMVTYNFARLSPTNEIASFKTNQLHSNDKATIIDFEDLRGSNEMIFYGDLGSEVGAIIAFRQDQFINEIKDKASESKGYVNISVKTLWIAKGAFCEE